MKVEQILISIEITNFCVDSSDYISFDENLTVADATGENLTAERNPTNSSNLSIDSYEKIASDRGITILKTDENGNEQWSQTFGVMGMDTGHSVQQTNDGGYIIVGIKNEQGGNVYLIKTKYPLKFNILSIKRSFIKRMVLF